MNSRNNWQRGQRVEVSKGSDRWMGGDGTGTVEGTNRTVHGDLLVVVRMDRSGDLVEWAPWLLRPLPGREVEHTFLVAVTVRSSEGRAQAEQLVSAGLNVAFEESDEVADTWIAEDDRHSDERPGRDSAVFVKRGVQGVADRLLAREELADNLASCASARLSVSPDFSASPETRSSASAEVEAQLSPEREAQLLWKERAVHRLRMMHPMDLATAVVHGVMNGYNQGNDDLAMLLAMLAGTEQVHEDSVRIARSTVLELLDEYAHDPGTE